MTEPVLRIRGVRWRRGRFLLNIESLDVQPGAVLALLGPTGAGKSSLLRLLTGLETPDSGTIELDQAPLTPDSPPDRLRQVVLVSQRPLLVRGSVSTNVKYGLKFRSGNGAANVDAIIDELGLSSLVRQEAASLSGGQIQLVALARALCLKPRLLLLDEPSANLDPAHVGLVERAVLAARERFGTTMVWATHNLFQARRVSQRSALLLDGELAEQAETESFFENPQNPRSRMFVRGEMIY